VLLVYLILLLSVLPLFTLLLPNPYFVGVLDIFFLHAVAGFPDVPGVSAASDDPAIADEPADVGVENML
jgi:hypothetical protein